MPQARRTIAVALAALTLAAAGSAEAAKRARRQRSSPRESGAAKHPAPDRPARAQGPARASSPGHVSFVTEKRAYLDAGARDGLAARQSVALSRGGRAAGTCTIETLTDHAATCTGGRPRAGDTFRVAERAAPKTVPVRALPPVVDEGTLETRAAALAEAAFDKVDFHGTPGSRAGATARVTPGLTTWRTFPGAADAYSEARIDGIIQVPLGDTGLRFDGAFSAQRWQTSALERFRPDQPTRFYLWEAEVSRREADARTVLSVGRIWPWHTPGLVSLDGFQLGRRNESRTVEAGAYAGFLPTAESLAPSMDTWTAGLYGTFAQTGTARDLVRHAREEARLAVWRSPTTGLVGDAELRGHAWLGGASVGAGGRARLAPSMDGGPVLERATFDLSSRPSLAFGGGLHLRYFGATPVDPAPLRGEVPALAGSLHGLVDGRLALGPGVGLAAYGGAHRDATTGRRQVHGAAEVRLPRLLGDAGGLSLGGSAEAGWMRGAGAYAQVLARFGARAQLLARGSFGVTEFATPTAAPNLYELGGYLHLDGGLGPRLRARAWALVRAPLLVQRSPPPEASFGMTAGASVTGTF